MRHLWLVLTFVGCATGAERDGLGLMADPVYGLMNPFPSDDLVVDGSVAIPIESLPPSDTPMPVERVAWRSGFSPVQPVVIELDEVNASGFPGWRSPTPGQGSAQLWDLDAGVGIPMMAEVDQHPEASGNTVIMRPLAPIPDGHRVAAVLTTEATPRTDRFQALTRGERYGALLDELEALGVNPDDVALAWSFPVRDGRKPLFSALEQLTRPAPTLDVYNVRNAEDGDSLPLATFRQVQARFSAMRVVGEDNLLLLEPDGSVSPEGTLEAELFVHIPESVADAPAGSVPVMVVGHGMFGTPNQLFSGPGELGPFVEMADALGAIAIGTRWRGLDYSDIAIALSASNDVGRFPEVPELMVQGQVNTRTLVEHAVDGSLFDDPIFEGRSGQSLPDSSQVVYYGISMGGVLGGVMFGHDPPLQTGVFRVPGGLWSALLERSSQWELFEMGLVESIEDPVQRQHLYAVSQLFWDPLDPVLYGPELATRNILVQESVGDDTVANMGTRVLGRVMEAQLTEPIADAVWGMQTGSLPLPPGSRAYIQYTTNTEAPPDINRPAPHSDAHVIGMGWDGLTAQAVHFLSADTEGEVVHFCGDDPCSPDNQGSWEP